MSRQGGEGKGDDRTSLTRDKRTKAQRGRYQGKD